MAEMTAIVQQEWVDRYYSQGQLKDKRRNFLRSCNYGMFRRLVRTARLTNTLRRKRMSAGGGGDQKGTKSNHAAANPCPPPWNASRSSCALLCRHKNQRHSDPAAPEYGQCAAAPVGWVDSAYRNP